MPVPLPPRHRRCRCAGAIALELLLNLPVWLFVLFGVLGLGEMLSEAQQVSLASRVGAEEALRTNWLPPAGGVPDNVLEAIQRQLGSAGMCGSKVVLEHGAGGAPAMLISGTGRADRPAIPLPASGAYVRVTVSARAGGLTAGLFRSLGLSSRLLTQSVTFPYAVQPTEAR